MSKMTQIRNVPESIHRRLKAGAAEAGLSLSEYLLQELRETASRTPCTWLSPRDSTPSC